MPVGLSVDDDGGDERVHEPEAEPAILPLRRRSPAAGVADRDPDQGVVESGVDDDECSRRLDRVLDGVGARLPRGEDDVLGLRPLELDPASHVRIASRTSVDGAEVGRKP